MSVDSTRWVRLDPRHERRVPLPPWRLDDDELFAHGGVRIGQFLAAPDDPRFRFSGVCSAPLLAFPRTTFLLQPMGGPVVVADPMVAVLYMPDSVTYRHGLVDPTLARDSGASSPAEGRDTAVASEYDARDAPVEGDVSGWFELDTESVANRRDLRPAQSPPTMGTLAERDSALGLTLLPVDARTYLLQDQLLRYVEHAVSSGKPIDRQLVHTAAALVLDRTVGSEAVPASAAPDSTPARPTDRCTPKELATAETFRRRVASHRLGAPSLAASIEQGNASKAQLTRALRAHLGWTPHRYGLELRLRRVLTCISAQESTTRDGDAWSLADLARAFGFASHSHLTARFREVFGVVPSWLREGTAEWRLRNLASRRAASAAPGGAIDRSR